MLRGASNEKARRELEFRPRRLEWIQADEHSENVAASTTSKSGE
jgi:hypothetical protein